MSFWQTIKNAVLTDNQKKKKKLISAQRKALEVIKRKSSYEPDEKQRQQVKAWNDPERKTVTEVFKDET